MEVAAGSAAISISYNDASSQLDNIEQRLRMTSVFKVLASKEDPEKCLTHNGVSVMMASCDFSLTEQRWVLDGGRIVSMRGTCLAVRDESLVTSLCHNNDVSMIFMGG